MLNFPFELCILLNLLVVDGLLTGLGSGQALVRRGHSAVLECRTTKSLVKWIHQRVGSWAATNIIFIDGVLHDQQFYSINMSVHGQFDLTIVSANDSDAGRYYCCEIGDDGEKRSVELTVVADVSCSATTDAQKVEKYDRVDQLQVTEGNNMSLQCRVRYFGNLTRPQMFWTSTKGDLKSSSVESRTNDVDKSRAAEYQLVIRSVDRSKTGEVYSCTVEFTSQTESLDEVDRHRCTAPPIEVLFPVRNVTLSGKARRYHPGDTLECRADGNPSPTYQWIELLDSDSRVIASVAQLTLSEEGTFVYQCAAINVVQGQRFSRTATVTVTVANDEKHFNLMIASLSVGVLLCIVLTLLIVTIITCRRKSERHVVSYDVSERHVPDDVNEPSVSAPVSTEPDQTTNREEIPDYFYDDVGETDDNYDKLDPSEVIVPTPRAIAPVYLGLVNAGDAEINQPQITNK